MNIKKLIADLQVCADDDILCTACDRYHEMKEKGGGADCVNQLLLDAAEALEKMPKGGIKMVMKLEKENVRIIFMNLLDSMEHYGLEGKGAEHQSCYIAGALDMANAVIDAIGELGRGK